ncbi:MAG TPA: PH domain-containing protein [Candidatus Saccharimonadales bacterium]|nr:PH domain-containing protein [Candidatus Saccharimonadales bacterium]
MPPSENPNLPEEKPPVSEDDIAGQTDLFEKGEHQLAIVHRHPIGLIFIYLESLIGILIVIVFFALVTPDIFDNLDKESNRALLGLVVFGLAILVFFLFIATFIYQESRLLITDRSLVQIVQRGLFSRKVSRLSFSNVEDVNADQRGILATILNYGTLNIETAGEMENFNFKYTPKPNYYADVIIEARQRYAESLQEEMMASLRR